MRRTGRRRKKAADLLNLQLFFAAVWPAAKDVFAPNPAFEMDLFPFSDFFFVRILCAKTETRTGVTIFKLLFKSPEENYVFKCVFEKTFLVRTRVQSITFSESILKFRWVFTMVFESTTKPQWEAENSFKERSIVSLKGVLQWSSKAHTRKVL